MDVKYYFHNYQLILQKYGHIKMLRPRRSPLDHNVLILFFTEMISYDIIAYQQNVCNCGTDFRQSFMYDITG